MDRDDFEQSDFGLEKRKREREKKKDDERVCVGAFSERIEIKLAHKTREEKATVIDK